jgi:hypothetical protein
MILTKYDLMQLRKDRRGRRIQTKTSPAFKNLSKSQKAWKKQQSNNNHTFKEKVYYQEDGKTWTLKSILKI